VVELVPENPDSALIPFKLVDGASGLPLRNRAATIVFPGVQGKGRSRPVSTNALGYLLLAISIDRLIDEGPVTARVMISGYRPARLYLMQWQRVTELKRR
jgi:hypothetical protein